MNRVSDVFAFAASNVDYWDELLTGEDYPAELAKEAAALDAARRHIDESVVVILHAAAACLQEIEHDPPFGEHRPRAAATTKNHAVYPPLPKGRSDLYYMGFRLAPNDAGALIRLYPLISVKKSQRDRIRDQLDRAGVKHTPLDYDIWGEGVTLEKDCEIHDVAMTAARQLVELIDRSR